MLTTPKYAFKLPQSTDNAITSINAYNENFTKLDTFDTIVQKNIAEDGYIKYKSGLIIQWGTDITDADTKNSSKNFDTFWSKKFVTFPIRYSSVVFFAGAHQSNNVAAWLSATTLYPTGATFYFSGWDTCTDKRAFQWFAIGM